ncbi:MAG TPA: paraquat-inducible protein A [Stellaceae bacterium]|jgi:paraquat-inducible protein A
MTDTLLACRDCGQLHRADAGVLRRRWVSCRRCGARLWRRSVIGLADLFAFAATAVILFVLANAFPLFDISLTGDRRSGRIASGVVALAGYGGGISAVGVLVALIALLIPALSIGLVATALGWLNAAAPKADRRRRKIAGLWRAVLRLRPWSMLDVYLLGAVVAYTRLDQLTGVRVAIAAGGYALAALVLAQILIEQSLGRQRVWGALGDPAKYAPAPGDAWVLCLDCDLVIGVGTAGAAPRNCPRCAARLTPRRTGSLAATAALTTAGYILYVPANLLPVLTITRFGRTDPYTILGGVRDLATAGLWPLALLVLVASIIVPGLKLAGLTWFLIAVRLRAASLLRPRTALYRFINFIGRWSNIDVFVVSILVALVQFGNLTTIAPGPGIACFAAVVAATMVATRVFDPRLMWDAALARRHG